MDDKTHSLIKYWGLKYSTKIFEWHKSKNGRSKIYQVRIVIRLLKKFSWLHVAKYTNT